MANVECNKNLFDFLMYSYFGIISEDDDEVKKVKCAKQAYRDLARTIKYRYSSKVIEKAKKGEAAYIFNEIRNSRIDNICIYIIECISICPVISDDFDKWHKCVCYQINEKMNDPYNDNDTLFKEEKGNRYTFTIGQSQKWLNMTLKYMWLLNILPDSIKEYLHVPIDSYILEKLQKCGIEKITGSEETFYYKDKEIESDTREAWSEFHDYDKYFRLQKKIRNIKKSNSTLIEWENKAWMKIAEERNKKSAAKETKQSE